MQPGIYAGIPNNDYHGGPGISKSGLDLIDHAPIHYKSACDARAANDNEKPSDDTTSYFVGRELHSLVLEPALFVKEYTLAFRQSDVPHAIDDREQLVAMVQKLNEGRLPKLATSGSREELILRIREAAGTSSVEVPVEGQGVAEVADLKVAELKAILVRLNESRAGLLPTSGTRHELAELLRANGVEVTLWSDVKAEWEKVNGHRRILTPEQWTAVHAMRNSIMDHPAAGALLRSAQNVVIDLKTTVDASPDGFSKSLANYRYDVQAPYYLDGLREALRQSGDKPPAQGAAELSAYWVDQETGVLCRCRPDFWRGEPKHFVFIAVEKKPPYAVGVYVLDEDSMISGRAQYRDNLNKYAWCLANDNWPGYGDKVQTISVPAWHLRKNEHLVGAP